MSRTTTLTIAALSVLFLGLVPATAVAQTPVHLDFRGGIAVPSGDMSDLMDSSATYTVGLDIPLASTVDLRFQGGSDLYKGKLIESGIGEGRDVANLTLTHGHAGVNVGVAEPVSSGFTFDLQGLVGASVASSERDAYSTGQGGAVIVDLSTVYPSVVGGVSLGYQFSPRVSAFVGGQGFLIFSDEDETQAYTRLGEGDAQGMSSITSFPLTLGLQFEFPG